LANDGPVTLAAAPAELAVAVDAAAAAPRARRGWQRLRHGFLPVPSHLRSERRL